ncbi:MAG: hypothetical protein MUP76_10900 [Acidimicrobiia bacterium]|nr:hypothetical protein [Acidimicrobiia bacterium]
MLTLIVGEFAGESVRPGTIPYEGRVIVTRSVLAHLVGGHDNIEQLVFIERFWRQSPTFEDFYF